MIQRKQSIFLLLAALMSIVCLCMPLATIEFERMGADGTVFNLMTRYVSGEVSYNTAPLFLFLVVSVPVALFTIFKYNNRRLQMRLCNVCTLFCVLWYCYFIGFFAMTMVKSAAVHFNVASVLPLLSLILYVMARKAIKADDELVRSADRIR
jgi:hypothetical protein